MAKYLLLLIAALASPAMAQNMEGVWKGSKDRIAAPPANVSFPREMGGLRLTGTSESSDKGSSLDNVAEYRSADRAIWGTIYVYRPGYPDAAIAAYMTDRAIRLTYGSGLKRLSQAVVSIGGQPGSAIRMTYSGGVIRDSGPLASAAAFAHVSGWILVFRVSGPIDRPTEVAAALDAMLATTQFTADAYVLPAAPLDFGPPCPARPSGTVKPFNSENPGANALGAAMMMTIVVDKPKKKDDALTPNFPADGLTRVCVRGTLADPGLDVLQPAGVDDPDIILLPLNDTGDTIWVRKNILGGGYTLGKADIGRTRILGEVDRMPDTDQLGQIFGDSQNPLLAIRSTVTIKANSNVTIAVAPDLLKK